MRAWLKPKIQSPHAQPYVVELIARTGNHKIKIQGVNPGAQMFSVDRFRLYAETSFSRRVSETEFNSLPWQGSGLDPAKTESTAELFAALEVKP